MAERSLEIAASIVKAQVSVREIPPEGIEQILMKTFLVLQRMQIAEQQGTSLESAREPRFQTAPRGKWSLPMKTPLSARSLSGAGSRAAKKRGLPENLAEFLQERKRKAVEAAPPSPFPGT